MASYRSIFREDLFAGQVIIVTGGGSGIGRITAHELASLGAHVVLASRTQAKLDTVRDEIVALGGACSVKTCNIREEDQVKALFEFVLNEQGAVHGLVNNGGGQFLSPAEFISTNGWNAVINTNLNGTWLMIREAYQRYMGKHGGTIVNMLMANSNGFPGMVHSGAARAGIENMTKTLAVEWAKAGVRINAVAPGTIISSGLDTYPEHVRSMIDGFADSTPFKRLGTMSEVSAAIVFLLSPAASYISGVTLKIDGASTLWRNGWPIEPHEKSPKPYEGFEDS